MNENNVFKMDKKRFISLILLFLFIISISSSIVFASSESDSIPSMNIDLYLKGDGTLHVKKIIHYSLTGPNNDYRNIYIESQQNPENLKVSIQGAYADPNIHDFSLGKSVDMFFFSDPEMTVPIGKKDVNVIIEYDLMQSIYFYNDTAYLHYNLVDNSWHQYVGNVNANIHLKSNNNVKYWLNTSTNAKNSSWNGNNLKITAQNILLRNSLELNMIIPKDQFDANPKNGVVVNGNFFSKTNYENPKDFTNYPINISPILALLMLLGSFIPLFIYLRYGREPKIDYNMKYEVDLPTDDPPAIVNAVCAGNPKRIGIANLDGFRATILDLIDRNYLLLNDGSSVEDYYGSLLLEINPDYDPDTLWEFEVQILDFLKKYEQNGIISMDYISERLKDYNDAEFFKDFYINWRKEVLKSLLEGNSFKNTFYSKGDDYLKAFGYLGLISSFIFLEIGGLFVSNGKFLANLGYPLIILFVASAISLILPQKIAGQWTPYGLEYYKRWNGFKRYIKDFSLIKNYPPESIKVWNKYLIYATALGAADGVRKAMELLLPQNQSGGSNVYIYQDAVDVFGFLLKNAIGKESEQD